jgi:hypothetical protein
LRRRIEYLEKSNSLAVALFKILPPEALRVAQSA